MTYPQGFLNKIIQGDCLEVSKILPDESIDCCVTSPPYWHLRDYGVEGQLGLEKTPEEYVQNLVNLFQEVRRVLKPQGTLWLNLGDSYAEKNLVGIPWRVALALQAAGWYLRQDIIWSKPAVMPESVTDRCTKSHEYVFLLSKNPRYYFDAEAIKEPAVCGNWGARLARPSNKSFPDELKNGIRSSKRRGEFNGKTNALPGREAFRSIKNLRNKRSVWTVSTKPFKEAHFATFPEDLITPMVLAGCPQGGVVLDPFMGSGTTALIAQKLGRNYIGIELNPAYIEIASKRVGSVTPAFL